MAVLAYSLLQEPTTAARPLAEAAPEDIVMQTHVHPKPVKALPRPVPRRTEPRATTPTWKPQEVGLSREEIRDIVIDLIG